MWRLWKSVGAGSEIPDLFENIYSETDFILRYRR